MHEVGIVNGILDTVIRAARGAGPPRAALVTLRSCISSCRQSSRLRSSVVMDFFMSGNGASRRDEHNQQQAHYATGNQNPDQHIPCADTNHRCQPNPQ